MEAATITTNLSHLFGPGWEAIETREFEGGTYYVGCEVVSRLGLKSTNWAIRRKISRRNWIMRKVEAVNRVRTVYLVTLEGIIELIMVNNSPACNAMKPYIARYLVRQGLDGFNFRPPLIQILRHPRQCGSGPAMTS